MEGQLEEIISSNMRSDHEERTQRTMMNNVLSRVSQEGCAGWINLNRGQRNGP